MWNAACVIWGVIRKHVRGWELVFGDHKKEKSLQRKEYLVLPQQTEEKRWRKDSLKYQWCLEALPSLKFVLLLEILQFVNGRGTIVAEIEKPGVTIPAHNLSGAGFILWHVKRYVFEFGNKCYKCQQCSLMDYSVGSLMYNNVKVSFHQGGPCIFKKYYKITMNVDKWELTFFFQWDFSEKVILFFCLSAMEELIVELRLFLELLDHEYLTSTVREKKAVITNILLRIQSSKGQCWGVFSRLQKAQNKSVLSEITFKSWRQALNWSKTERQGEAKV